MKHRLLASNDDLPEGALAARCCRAEGPVAEDATQLSLLIRIPTRRAARARDLLISVTRFFRDEESFETMATRVFPDLIATAERSEPLRLWIPGCATGQEAYSFAMVLTEAIERSGRAIDFKIFATDVDREALHAAAEGTYRAAQIVEVSPERLERFFVPHGDAYVVDRALRRTILFAPHNIARDPPFTRLDLISCRNLLIYLNGSLQKRVIASLTFALRPEGYLVVGASESLADAGDMFEVVDPRWKVFKRLPGISPSLPVRAAPLPGENARAAKQRPISEQQRAQEIAFRLLVDRIAPASVLVSDTLDLVSVFGNAGELLRVPLGEATQRIVDLVPDELRNTVAMVCHRALASKVPVSLAVLATESAITSVRAMPFEVPSGQRFLVLAFERGTELGSTHALGQVKDVPEDAKRMISELQRELGFVRENLQATIEQLETANEELQATNEELLASNEELQSTNEELQSVNEELGAVNAEFQMKITELTELTTDLEYLFRASPVGTLFLDEKLYIRRFSPELTRLFNVIDRDVGRPIQHLSQNFEDRAFVIDAARVLATGEPIERQLEGTREGQFMMRLVPYRTPQRHIRGVVADFVDVTLQRKAEAGVLHAQRILDSLEVEVAVLDKDSRITMVNQAWRRFWEENGGAANQDAAIGQRYLDVCEPPLRQGVEDVLARRIPSFSFEYPCDSTLQSRWFMLYAAPVAGGEGVVVSHMDVTKAKASDGRPPSGEVPQ